MDFSKIYNHLKVIMPYNVIIFSILFLFMNNIGYYYLIKFIYGIKKCGKLSTYADCTPMTDKIPTVSIIIPAYNEEKNISEKITNILKYKYPMDKLEVIVVDDGSLDKTKNIINNLIIKNKPLINIRLICLDHQGPANALKIGTDEAKGEFILWTDSDAYHRKDNLIIGINHLSDNKIGAVCGTVKPTSATKNSTVRGTGIAIMEKIRFYESCIDSVFFTTGTFFMFREQFKNFITDSINYDSVLAIRIRKKGFRILFDKNIVSYHVEPTSTWTQLKRKKRMFLGLLELFFQNMTVNFNPKYGKYGMIIAPRNMLLYISEPLVFMIFLIELFRLFGLNTIYIIMIMSFTLYLVLKTRFRNISLAVFEQLLGYLINFFAYFEFAIKKLSKSKIKYVPGKK